MSGLVRQQVPLSQYTTLHVGGVADYVYEVTTMEELGAACQFAEQTGMPPLILGGGSNMLISDEGYRGVALHVALQGKRYEEMEGGKVRLVVAAGEVFDEVVARTAEKGLWGLENLSSIPGTVGATPVQNVGAYGVEVASLIESVTAIHIQTLEEKIFTNEACQFGYRDSFFKTEAGKSWVITSVTFILDSHVQPQLTYGDLAVLQEKSDLTPQTVRDTVVAIRAEKFPDWTVVGTAGSFFKNPIVSQEQYEQLKTLYAELPGFVASDGRVKIPLGYVLDKVCSLRGYREGNVALYEKQALVLVAYSGASATEIKIFVEKIKKIVYEKTNIQIECEVRFI